MKLTLGQLKGIIEEAIGAHGTSSLPPLPEHYHTQKLDFNSQFIGNTPLSRYLERDLGLPSNTLYFDDADLVQGDRTLVYDALNKKYTYDQLVDAAKTP